MPEYKIIMPSKPRVVLEEGNKGIFEMGWWYNQENQEIFDQDA